MAILPTEQDGLEASKTAREITLDILQDKGPTLESVVLRLKQSLNAKETKAAFDKSSGTWVYSKAMTAHRIRLDAVKLALDLYDTMPSQKHDVNVEGGLSVFITRKIVEGSAKE